MATMTETLSTLPLDEQLAYLQSVADRMSDPLGTGHSDEHFLIRQLLRLVRGLVEQQERQ